MDHIQKIQDIIDEHKTEMPTGVVSRVMAECQNAYETQLYKIMWTVVDSHAHIEIDDDESIPRVKLSHKTQTLLVEAVDAIPKSGRQQTERGIITLCKAGHFFEITHPD